VILIDPPAWPAHGRLWSHLVSDRSSTELHAFAERVGAPLRAFEGDHYDIPADRHAQLVAAGAVPVTGRELLHRLVAAGLRRPKRHGDRVIAGLASMVGPGRSMGHEATDLVGIPDGMDPAIAGVEAEPPGIWRLDIVRSGKPPRVAPFRQHAIELPPGARAGADGSLTHLARGAANGEPVPTAVPDEPFFVGYLAWVPAGSTLPVATESVLAVRPRIGRGPSRGPHVGGSAASGLIAEALDLLVTWCVEQT